MKAKLTFSCLGFLGILIALAFPLAASADGCPPDNPNCNIAPPQSIEVNPNPLHADGSPVDLPVPGALSPQIVPMPLPRRVDPLPLDDTPSFETLPVPLRLQDPADVSCGVQALGMALSGLGEDAPSSDAILAFLENRGMMYDFGTGVEELAFAAQSLGYEGSLPFHGWTLEDLREELAAGRPVVVALGNGEYAVGHFVTVTGISTDGRWIAINDPSLGEQVLSTEEFLRMWSTQGNSGVTVGMESPVPGLTLMPWVALLAGLMALITQTPLARLRKGIGGNLDPGGGNGPGQAPPGYHWVFRQVPKFELQEVQEGWKTVPKTVPNMVGKYMQVGWTTSTERIPRYKTVQVQEGWTYTYERMPTYRTERYIRYWRTEYTRRATFRYTRGRRVFTGYRRVARRVPVYSTRRVFAGWQTQRKRMPRMVQRTVLAGYDLVEKRVPKYDWVEVQDGWRTEYIQIPNMVRKQVQVGMDWRWELEEGPDPKDETSGPETSKPPTDEDKLTRFEREFLDPIIAGDDALGFAASLDPNLDRPFDCFTQLFPKGRPSCPTIVPNIDGYNEKAAPAGITWSPASDIPLSLIMDYATGELVQETNAAQHRIAPRSYGLCGQVALSAILRTTYPNITANSVVDLYEEQMGRYDPNPNYTDADNLARFVNTAFGDDWSARVEDLSANQRFRPPREAESLQLATVLQDYIMESSIVMPWVEIVDGSQQTQISGMVGATDRERAILHWVAITGLSEQWDASRPDSPFNWVRIYNPFDNQVEYYSWADFESAWSGVAWDLNHEAVVLRRWNPDVGPSPLP